MPPRYSSGGCVRDPPIAIAVDHPASAGLFQSAALEHPALAGLFRAVDRLLLDPPIMFKHLHLLRDFDYMGMHHYSLTWCCDARDLVFTQRDRVALVRDQILRACRESELEVIVDCYMPDHVHQLVRGRTPSANGRKFLHLGKQYSGFYFKQAFNKRLWQRYGHDELLTDYDDVKSVARYIIENPVRAGLVKRIEDHPFTGSHVYSFEELIRWAYS
jgi:putative transposase